MVLCLRAENFISNAHKNEENIGNGLILIFNGFSISVVWNKAHFFLFDPHSRASNGLICHNGTSVLLKFSSLLAIEKYLLHVYVKFGDTMLVDLQYVKVFSSDEVDFQTQNSVERIKACKRNYTCEKYTVKLEQNKRYKSRNSEAVLTKKTFNIEQKIIKLFWKKIRNIRQKIIKKFWKKISNIREKIMKTFWVKICSTRLRIMSMFYRKNYDTKLKILKR